MRSPKLSALVCPCCKSLQGTGKAVPCLCLAQSWLSAERGRLRDSRQVGVGGNTANGQMVVAQQLHLHHRPVSMSQRRAGLCLSPEYGAVP